MSVFGDLENLGEDGVNVAEDAGSALLHGTEGVAEMTVGVADHFAATGAELAGQQDLRDSLDNSAMDHRDAGMADFQQTGHDIENEVHDVVGSTDMNQAIDQAGYAADDGSGYEQQEY